MKKYEYVNIDIDWFFGSGTIEHREIIDKYAAMGYTYKGYIPTKMNADGRIKTMDLIFEIDAETPEKE